MLCLFKEYIITYRKSDCELQEKNSDPFEGKKNILSKKSDASQLAKDKHIVIILRKL